MDMWHEMEALNALIDDLTKKREECEEKMLWSDADSVTDIIESLLLACRFMAKVLK